MLEASQMYWSAHEVARDTPTWLKGRHARGVALPHFRAGPSNKRKKGQSRWWWPRLLRRILTEVRRGRGQAREAWEEEEEEEPEDDHEEMRPVQIQRAVLHHVVTEMKFDVLLELKDMMGAP
jgi:hypothetical protein